MDLKGCVQKAFNDAIKSAPVDSELKKAATRHPNTKSFLQNLYKQLVEVEVMRMKQGKPRLKAKTVQDTVRDFTYKLLQGIETEALRRGESDLARIKREQEAQKQKDLEVSERTGNFVGEFAQLQEGLKPEELPSDSSPGVS